MEKRTQYLAITLSVLSIAWVSLAVAHNSVSADSDRLSSVEARRLERLKNLESDLHGAADSEDEYRSFRHSPLSVRVTGPSEVTPGMRMHHRILVTNNTAKIIDSAFVRHLIAIEGKPEGVRVLRIIGVTDASCDRYQAHGDTLFDCTLHNLKPGERRVISVSYDIQSCALGLVSTTSVFGTNAGGPYSSEAISSGVASPVRTSFSFCSPSDRPSI